ncbi:MAG: tRNA (N6-isopentenyl adenosine(37)-C2)-methylthiotransferase MiaB [Oscillospiraceae bacterium]|nr:tRNA (N6-isopentenyl adenosine(37)-C2)-methylthiotransferase MiaB [Oscillospiraceae bacterium]
MAVSTEIISPEALAQQGEYMDRVRAWWASQGVTPRAYIDTYGCQQNEADSERMLGMLLEMGYQAQEEPEGADIIIINTCAVREHAEQRVFGNLGALTHTKRRHGGQKIFFTGCMAGQQIVVDRIRKSYPHVDCVLSSHAQWQLPELLYHSLTGSKRQFVTPDKGNIAEGLPVARKGQLKGWVSIMYGCNNFCTYCIVPYVRGRERSRQPEDIVREVREMIDSGFKDITLLGQNVNSYGKDLGLGVDFADLLRMLSELPGDFVLRFMTSHPKDASKKLFDTMASSPKIAKHIHLPFQAGNDRVLKAMNRSYTSGQYLELVRYAREKMPDLVLTSDVIVGFPGETDEEFEDTLKLVEQVRYDALFTFIFSPRTGTPAAKMDDPFTKAQKQARFDRLLETQNRISQEKHSAYVGKTLRVLVDGQDGEFLTARTDGGRLVRLEGDPALVGTFQNVTITGNTTWSLTGSIEEA